MRLALSVRSLGGVRSSRPVLAELESAGLDVLLVGESYTLDAISMVGYLAAATERVQIGTGIISVYLRSAALVAMTAVGCDGLTGGRFILGLGTSGPGVARLDLRGLGAEGAVTTIGTAVVDF